MARTNFSGPVVIADVQIVTTTATLAAGTVDVDLSAQLSTVTGATATRNAATSGPALECALDTPTAGIVRVTEGAGTSNDAITVIAFGTPA